MRMIGQGNFGKVKLVYDTADSNRTYAMKIIKKKRQLKGMTGNGNKIADTDIIQNEIAIMKKLVSKIFLS